MLCPDVFDGCCVQCISAVTEHAERQKIGFIQLTLGTTYHAAMSDRFSIIGKDAGADVSMVVSNSRSADEQLSLAEDLISKGVPLSSLSDWVMRLFRRYPSSVPRQKFLLSVSTIHLLVRDMYMLVSTISQLREDSAGILEST